MKIRSEKKGIVMAQSYLLSSVDISRGEPKLKARVDRMWDVYNPKNNNELICIEMVLTDEEGSQIVANLKKRFIAKYRPLLTEGSVYLLKNFDIQPAKENFRVVQCDRSISIYNTTSIKPVPDADVNIPMHVFDFVPYDRVPERCDDLRLLTDVMGTLRQTTNLETYGACGKKRSIVLENLARDQIRITLFGKCAEMLADVDMTQSPVLIVTSTMVRTFRGDLSITSSSATKIYINLPIPETEGYLADRPDGAAAVQIVNNPAMVLDYDMYVDRRRTIQQVLQFARSVGDEPVKFLVLATVHGVSMKSGWRYTACGGPSGCNRMVSKEGNMVFCSFCSKAPTMISIRYRIELGVQDGNSSTTFVLFNTCAEKLLKISAADLADAHTGDCKGNALENGQGDSSNKGKAVCNDVDGDEEKIPQVIEKLVGSSFLFSISVTSYNRTASFQTFTADRVYREDEIPAPPHVGGGDVSRGTTLDDEQTTDKSPPLFEASTNTVNKVHDIDETTVASVIPSDSGSSVDSASGKVYAKRIKHDDGCDRVKRESASAASCANTEVQVWCRI